MRWFSRPERREILLVLGSVGIYLFAYNIESSLTFVGIDPIAAQGAIFRHLGFKNTRIVGSDGRKPPGWRDNLESDIFGDWDWEEGNVAGDGAERSQGKGSGRHGAQWVQRESIEKLNTYAKRENLTVNDALYKWGDNVPSTSVIKHVPGYTILDNVFIHDGSVYLVTDDKGSLPPMNTMVESTGNGFDAWEVLSKEEARNIMGTYGAIIRGVSWMATNPSQYNMTLFDFWRLHSSLDGSIDSEGRTTLSPPHRLIYPHNRFFTDANPPFEKHWIHRQRFDTGVHPYLLKAAFPHLVVQFYEDWEDHHKLGVPFMYERLMISDRRVAASSINKGQPINSPVFGLETSKWWWEPVRRTLALYFDRLVEETKGGEPKQGFFGTQSGPKKVITLLDNQLEGSQRGYAVMATEGYEQLTRALQKLARNNGYEFQIVSTDLEQTSWDKRMDTIVRSTIVLGAHGNHLFDSVWMRPSSQATLIEMFPKNEFVLNRELAARSVGINYIAWWGNQYFSGETLPEASGESNHPVSVDANAVATAIHDILSGKEH